jgi:pyrimidine and pyridine-specific 5'-nucleotidase
MPILRRAKVSSTGEKITKFGQQTNICLGISIIEDLIISMTVDGVIRVLSIGTRQMVRQYRADDVLRAAGHAVGGSGMMSWFSARRGDMAVSLLDSRMVKCGT